MYGYYVLLLGWFDTSSCTVSVLRVGPLTLRLFHNGMELGEHGMTFALNIGGIGGNVYNYFLLLPFI